VEEPVPVTPEPEQAPDLNDLIDYEIEMLKLSKDYISGSLLTEVNEEIKTLIESKEFVG